MEPVKEQQIEWVRAIMAHVGAQSANALAKLAGTDPANIQRPLSANFKGKFGTDTLAKIAAVANVRPMEYPNRAGGFGEVEAAPFQYEQQDAIGSNLDRAVRDLCKGRNGRDPWVVRSHALELSGILPGDIMIVDLNMQPRTGDVVCAQIYQWSAGRAQTVFRLFDPPFLLTNSIRNGPAKPTLVDGKDVVVVGVVDALFRPRRSDDN